MSQNILEDEIAAAATTYILVVFSRLTLFFAVHIGVSSFAKMDFKFKEDQEMDSQMAVIDNLAILKKWSNSECFAHIPVAMPDHLRLQFAKMCMPKDPHNVSEEESKRFKRLAVSLMEENRKIDPYEELAKKRVESH
ncbi:hypothetical protein RF11_05603 [Thelohanellus kitauei]|uniref:Uncharacterized protein n=1 Tax=Thelohanellus kitauei TaxID=669202 RepID=A0A0C2IUK8_THEKT|nr:hypothetical protein RF11_05601 [Thelohanellus kitauei]KII60529.1 hypothetical protein RF11_05603 [Thelohanellus kitauei]